MRAWRRMFIPSQACARHEVTAARPLRPHSTEINICAYLVSQCARMGDCAWARLSISAEGRRGGGVAEEVHAAVETRPSGCRSRYSRRSAACFVSGRRISTPTPLPRRRHRELAGQPVRLNISNEGERIYHVPGQEFYNRTRISAGKGERGSARIRRARNAGWRRSRR